jgi:hypothetical protein
MTHALSTPCFDATRTVLNGLDKNVFSPLCSVEILAIPPRIVQIATNVLGLAGSAVSGVALSGLCLLPLPEAFKGRAVEWKQDAWTLTQQLVDKIGRLFIALIPFAGTKFLEQFDFLKDQRLGLIRCAEDLEAGLRQAQGNLEVERTHVKELNAQLEAALAEARQTRILEVEKGALNAQVHELEGAQQKAVSDLASVQEVVEQLEAARAADQQRVPTLEGQIQSLQQEAEHLREEANASREQTATERATAQELATHLDAAQAEIADLQQSRNHLQEQVSSLSAEVDRVNADLDEMAQQLQPVQD